MARHKPTDPKYMRLDDLIEFKIKEREQKYPTDKTTHTVRWILSTLYWQEHPVAHAEFMALAMRAFFGNAGVNMFDNLATELWDLKITLEDERERNNAGATRSR